MIRGFTAGAVTVLAAGALWLTPAAAQDTPELRDNRISISAGLTRADGYDVGGASARLRGNGTGPTPPAFTLFTADSRFSATTGAELRVGFSLTPRLMVEAGAGLSRPRVAVTIAGDAESTPQELPGEQLQQYVFDGGVSWQLPVSFGRRVSPFVLGGAAYVRQLHEDRTSAETGRIYYAGGGARLWLRGGHDRKRPVGLRGEYRFNLRRQGIDFEDKMRAYPTVSLFLFIGI